MFNRKPRAWMRAGQLVLGTLMVAGMAGGSGCLERPVRPVGPRSTAVISEKLTQSSVDKIDLILAIDNSRSMADKQQILALAVPDLVKGLVNPACINPNTGNIDSTPAGPLDKCPDGTQREFDPVLDIHVGIISSSLGGHGSDACASSGMGKQSNNDKAHLLARKDATMAAEVETYQNLKFLAWDPDQHLKPAGEADILTDSGADGNNTALVSSLTDMVIGVGQVGCGYEAQLESWYRFLIDPDPPEEVTIDGDGAVLLKGVDKTLLDQRKSFLRSDSLLAIIMLTDENDCSIREAGQFYYAAQQKGGSGTFHLPRARAVCDQNPNDECCFSCGQKGPKDDAGNYKCDPDPVCKDAMDKTVYLGDKEDTNNLRCWEQKRRFGIDFLYSTDRYVNALKTTTVANRNGDVVANPIFSDLDQSDANSNTRTTNLVFFAGIVGVPWQDIARTTAAGAPDLKAGLDPDKKPRGGFKNADEMIAPLPGKDFNTWDLIIGDPSGYPAAASASKDPLMDESIDKRSGMNPVTGDAVVDASQPLANKINGHDWTVTKRDDLQYACIFDLVKVDASGNISPDTRDCSTPGMYAGCDCEDKMNDNPLCKVNAGTGSPTDQVRAKAYPGIRELQVLKDVGSQGIVASVCPAQLKKPGDSDFGYRPAIGAIIDRLKLALGGQCLSRTLTADAKGQVPCLILEASKVDDGKASSCNACKDSGRAPVDQGAGHQAAVDAISSDNPDAGYNCFCEIEQLANAAQDPAKPPITQTECEKNYDQSGYELCACQYTDPGLTVQSGGKSVDGWCYVDETSGIGNEKIVEKCSSTERRLIRFAGKGEAKAGATLFITCTGDTASN
jgi:hypothetical protein